MPERPNRQDQLEALFLMTEGANAVSEGIPMLLSENPTLPQDVVEVLEIAAKIIPSLTALSRQLSEYNFQYVDMIDDLRATVRKNKK